MWVRPSICGQLVKMLIMGHAHYCQLIIKTVIRIYHEQVLFSKISVSQINFKKADISKNRSSNFRGFTVYWPQHERTWL